MTRDDLKKIIVICGPTASGKSRLSCDLALKFNGEIINADSRQFYREFSIGVDKPSTEIRKLIPHHLYDIVSVRDHFNVSQYVKVADAIVDDIISRGKVPILTGGSGLYIRAFLFGLFDTVPVGEEIRLRLKEKLKREGLDSLYEDLKLKDPQSCDRIHPHDSVRIVRALEIFESTGKTISEWQLEHGFQKARYEYIKLGYSIPRDILYKRINERVIEMISKGLQNEVEYLYKLFPGNEIILKTIGYAQWSDFLKGLQSLEQTIELIGQASRKYAKRQMTWFNKEPDIHWFIPPDGDKITSLVMNFIR